MKQYLKTCENIENNIMQKIKNNKKVFFIILCIGIVIHLAALTNKLVQPDEIEYLFSKGNGMVLGRWFLDVTKYIFPNYSMPAFNGIIALILLSISACFVSNVLEVKSDFHKILIGLVLISFPTFTCTLTYMFTVHSYMISLLMAVLAVYFGKKNKKVCWVLSIILLTLSLGIYQAYISITATLFILILIKKTLHEKDTKKIVIEAVKFLSILLLGLVLYAIVNKIVIQTFGVKLSSYQGTSSMGTYTITGILIGLLEAYKYVFLPFLEKTVLTPMSVLRMIYILCLLLDIILVSYKIWKNRKNKLNSLFAVFFILLIPITMNMLYILNEKIKVYAVMQLGYSFIFISLILLLDDSNEKEICFGKWIKLLIVIQIFFCMIVANETYLQMHLAYQNSYAFYEGVVTQIKQTEGFDSEIKIAIVGTYYTKELNHMEEFSDLLPIGEFGSSSGLINSYSKLNFIRNYIGFKGNFIEEKEVRKVLKDNEEFMQMPDYPYYGSVKKIGDLIVVKLSQ